MTKYMFALWGAGTAELLDDSPRRALAQAGVTRLQVNLDDEPVAQAMRIPASDPAISAIVSVWTDSGPDELDGVLLVLDELSDRVAGWQVDERRPIDHPEVGDGTRADALANTALLRRPDELTQEEWLHRWLVDHTPVAMATQATFGYLQNVVVASVTPDAPPVAALVEELFPTAGITDIHAFYGSGGDDGELNDRITRLMTSVGRFGADRGLDLVPSGRYLFDPADC
ncbi:MAG: hypothetical protein WB767_17340 [Nocardioides sp.]